MSRPFVDDDDEEKDTADPTATVASSRWETSSRALRESDRGEVDSYSPEGSLVL